MVISLPPDSHPGQMLDYLDIHAERPSNLEVWILGLTSVGIISLSGVTGAILWPVMNSPMYKYIMALLIGLAAGTLTATALFQLIPEAFQLSSVENYLNTAAFGWLSIWIIFVIEAISKLAFKKSKNIVIVKEAPKKDEILPLKELVHSSSPDGQHYSILEKKKPDKVGAVAWMVIFGDGLHNFIDGMTIGAGYCQSISTGMGLSIAIACEEFPHELGDFAILLQSGMPISKALCFNFLSACTAFVGLVFGILIGHLEQSHYIFAFAGGLFLYISLTHLIPEQKAMLKERLKKSKGHCFIYLILQNLGMLLGGTLIYFITKYNDLITGGT